MNAYTVEVSGVTQAAIIIWALFECYYQMQNKFKAIDN